MYGTVKNHRPNPINQSINQSDSLFSLFRTLALEVFWLRAHRSDTCRAKCCRYLLAQSHTSTL